MTHAPRSDVASTRRAAVALLPILSLVAIAGGTLALVRTLLLPLPQRDFASIWLAGRAWRAGASPYSDAYMTMAEGLLPVTLRPWWWAYPPQWQGLAMLFSGSDVASDARAWLGFNLACLLLALIAAWPTIRATAPERRSMLLAFPTLLAITEGLRASFYLGQTSILMTLGTTLIATGTIASRRWMVAVGATILLLKPTLGLPICCVLFAAPALRVPVIAAIVTSGVAALPHILGRDPAGLVADARYFLNTAAQYGTVVFNWPANMTGLAQLASVAGLPAPSAPVATLLTAAVGVPLALLQARRWPTDEAAAFHALLATFCLVPLHNYDLIAACPLALFLPRFPRGAALLWLVGWLPIIPARSIARLFVEEEATLHVQALLASAGLACMFAAGVALARRAKEEVAA